MTGQCYKNELILEKYNNHSLYGLIDFRGSRLEVFYEKGSLKTFTNCTHLSWSFFFNKVVGLQGTI